MTELRPSFAPRSQMKRIFFFFPSCPGRPMVPSARACFMTSGMSTRVDKAMARLVLAEALRKLRLVMRLSLQSRLECRIKLLFLETLECHEHGDHATDAGVVSGSRHSGA